MLEPPILVLAEKPDVANKIALSLFPTGVARMGAKDSYDIPNAFDGKHYVICSALGHLYNLADLDGKREIFPILDIAWRPRAPQIGKRRDSRKFRIDSIIYRKIGVLAGLSSTCRMKINACDYDLEGETIGSNALVFGSLFDESRQIFRAKFSTLTVTDIREAFEKAALADGNMAAAGKMRHFLDFVWGINLSRGLSSGNSNRTKIARSNLTIGRVQGPTLAFVVERELERQTYVPVPKWLVSCKLNKSSQDFFAEFVDQPIRERTLALEIQEAVSKTRLGTVTNVTSSRLSIPPRYPFDLSELQKEGFRLYRLSPKVTLSAAQKLYQNALISYPRTDSQKLPPGIAFDRILHDLSSLEEYSKLFARLQSDTKRRNIPVQGPKDDPAHPAIYPTGEKPTVKLSMIEARIFDLIVRRFFNAFAPSEIVEKIRTIFDIAGFDFFRERSTVLEEGWTHFYPFHTSGNDSPKVSFREGEKVNVTACYMPEIFEEKPASFTEGTLLSQMENEGIGTKATRAETIETLINRKYIRKEHLQLEPTTLGTRLVENISEASPSIASTRMTREMEKKLELIKEGKLADLDLAIEMLSHLRPVMRIMRQGNFKLEFDIPDLQTSDSSKIVLGPCPKCKKGNLELRRSPKTSKRFIRCTNFVNFCRTSSPAIPRGQIYPANSSCLMCGWPEIHVRSSARSKECSNYYCPSKRRKL